MSVAQARADDPHGAGRVEASGAPLARARKAVVMLHGRGGSPADMLGLAAHLAIPGMAFVAPAAAGGSWWPRSFLAPLAANEPGLSSGLRAVGAVLGRLAAEGVGPERTVLLGLSQGACLALEYAARNAAPFAGIVALSGALVGTADGDGTPRDDLYGHGPKRFDYPGRMDGVPVYLGCHERDPHIPLARAKDSATVFGAMGAKVELRVYPGAGHGVVEEGILQIHRLLGAVRPPT